MLLFSRATTRATVLGHLPEIVMVRHSKGSLGALFCDLYIQYVSVLIVIVLVVSGLTDGVGGML